MVARRTFDELEEHCTSIARELKEDWLSPRQAAELLGVSTTRVHYLAQHGQLPHAEPPGRKTFLYYAPLLRVWRKKPRKPGRPRSE